MEDPYRDDQLVQLYDLDNPAGRDHAFYRALADEIGARTIIDLGCGTGLLTRSLVRPGRSVLGVDPSATMLEFACRQSGAEAVTWLPGDATAIPATGDADLAICTGNAIMHVTPEDLPTVLNALAASLRPGGTVSFESRNPAFREWERWTPEATLGERDTHLGRLREWLEVTDVDDSGRVVFDAHNLLPDEEDRIYTSVLYFRTAEELHDHLETAGFHHVTVTGNWDGEPVDDNSRILLFRAERG
jgi:SAM-dependent methyltransferase